MLFIENLETPRLTIRSWRKSDKDFTLSLWGDKENGKYMSDPVRENMDEAYLKCVDEMEDNPEGYYLVAEWKENGTPVGTCCIFPENGNYDIGYCISKEHWKEGLGTELIDAIIRWVKAEGGKSITGEVADNNLASVALLSKFGFSEDRKTRYKKWGEETYFDAHYYKLNLARAFYSSDMTEADLYKELGALTKDKDRWKESIPYVSSLLTHDSVKIQAKALWLLGEMGLIYPQPVQDTVPTIASFLDRPEPVLRERAVNALGRIGRGSYSVIVPYWASLFRFAADEEPKVRLAFIWASENIATNTPNIYEEHMPVFERLLHDADDKVRMEAPEIFRVLGKRRPEFVRPYVEQLRQISETDENRVVRIHCLGAIKATGSK